MANAGGQVGWDDVTIVGKRGPKGGSTLKTQSVILSAFLTILNCEKYKKI